MHAAVTAADILQKRSLMEISGTARRHINKHVACNAAHSHHTACMLDGDCRIDQLHADHPDLSYAGTHPAFLRSSARSDHRYVIIQKQQVIALGMAHTDSC